MAWTGSATIKRLGKHTARITGVSLGNSAVGTIGLAGGGGDISLPSDFPDTAPSGLNMSDIVKVSYQHLEPGAGNESRHIHVVKTDGPFLITVTNDQNQATSDLEIYVEFIHSIVR